MDQIPLGRAMGNSSIGNDGGHEFGARDDVGGSLGDVAGIACVSSASLALAHQHLWHPNLKKLCLLVPSLSNVKSFQCESCQLEHLSIFLSSDKYVLGLGTTTEQQWPKCCS